MTICTVLVGCLVGMAVGPVMGLPSVDVQRRMLLTGTKVTHITDGSVTCSGSTCRVTCADGFSPNHASLTVTLALVFRPDLFFKQAKCMVIKCGNPPSRPHGSLHCSSSHHEYSSTCKLACYKGYNASNSNTTTHCQSTGKWSTLASCEEILCAEPLTVPHGSLNCSQHIHKYGSTCKLTCDAGHTPSSSQIPSTCEITSEWSSLPFCNPPPVECEVCSGQLCGNLSSDGPLVSCPFESPYCMNNVKNYMDGTKTVTKKCASAVECNTNWWRDKTNCVDFDLKHNFSYYLSCYYCCTEDGCNRAVVPDKKTLFIGHD